MPDFLAEHDFLADMARSSRARAMEARAAVPERTLRARIGGLAPPAPLRPDAFLLIAEIKRSSPTAGPLGNGRSIPELAAGYIRGGAGAISVLTEPSRFRGSLDDLREASLAAGVPVMRKDFLTHPYQVLEARECGASGVLLIVKMLDDGVLREMLQSAAELGMFALVECFDGEDLDRCGMLPRGGASGTDVLLGLNTRDLRDLGVDPERLEHLAGSFPAGYNRIAESGLGTPEDARRAAELGYHGALVGGALMRAEDPAKLCRAMLEAAAAARGRVAR